MKEWIPLLAEAAGRCADDERLWRHFLRSLPAAVRHRIAHDWRWQAHGGQVAPPALPDGNPWRVWMIMAGRGFGKTRAGAAFVHAIAATGNAATRIALVGQTREEAVRVMVEGPSGLIATASPDARVRWVPTAGRIEWPSGASAYLYSAENAEGLRGPEHDAAWCDELGKWGALAGRGCGGRGHARPGRAEAAWDNLMMGLRRGTHPQCLITTTPRPTALMRRILALPDLVVTGGRTGDNPHLPPGFVAAMIAEHGGTRLGAQELDGRMVDAVEGSLFPRDMLARATMPAGMAAPYLAIRGDPWARRNVERIVVGVDPPAGTATGVGGDACGIVVMAARRDGLLIVLDDCSVGGLRPDGWARRVADAAGRWSADRVVAEANQGGEMVREVLRAADCTLPVKLVRAVRGKGARAEGVAAMMEAGKLMFAKGMRALADELEAMTVAGYAGAGSPDRADAFVWAARELIDGLPVPAHRAPRVRAL